MYQADENLAKSKMPELFKVFQAERNLAKSKMPELSNNKGTKPIVHQVYAVNVIYPNHKKCMDTKEVEAEERIILKAVNHSKPDHNQTEEIELISNIKPDINQTCT